MDDDVLLPNRGKAVAAEIADALGKTCVVGREDQIRALVDNQLLGVVEPENAVGREHVAARGVELFHQKPAQILRHRRVDREQDHVAAPTALQRRLEVTDEILGFFLKLDLAVAQHPEHPLGDDGKPREQMVEKQPDHLLDRQKPD